MAKFEDYISNSTLTWSDLNETTNNKIDRYEKLYGAYEEALKAEDEKTASKYEAQLIDMDSEILEMIKKQDKPKEDTKEETKVEVKEEPKVEAQSTPKEEVKIDTVSSTAPENVKVEVKQTPSEEEEDDDYDFGLMKW